jgi:hypothetical protein
MLKQLYFLIRDVRSVRIIECIDRIIHYRFFSALYMEVNTQSVTKLRIRLYIQICYYYYYYLLQLNFHSVAVVLTLVTNRNKYTHKKHYKNTVNTSTYMTKTPTQLSKHPHIHTLQNTYTHPHITKQVKTTLQDTHQMK